MAPNVMTTTATPSRAGFSLTNAIVVQWVKWRSSYVLALRSLWLHKLRSMLSVLGIIIGTAAVIALMAFGKGSMEDALEDIRRQGTTNVIIRSIKPNDDGSQKAKWVVSYGLTYDDYDRVKMIDTVVGDVPMRIFPQDVRRFDKLFSNARLVATTEAYARINQFQMAIGRFLVDSEDQQGESDNQKFKMVVVLGAAVAEELFPFDQPVGQSVVINREEYLVIGVIGNRVQRSAGNASSQGQEDFNKDIYIPIRTCRARFGSRVIIRQGGSRTGEEVELHQITLTINNVDNVRSTGDVVRNLLERYHQKKDWDVAVPLDRLEEAERARDRYNVLLAIIGGISLLVGGIGIMNIMLATVTERTREIGIRRALGAKRRDITMQFLIEAIVQTTLGGLLGTAAGMIVTYGLPLVARLFGATLPSALDVRSIFVSIFFAVFVGVVFGLYPAFRASRLDPIEALRHN
jgi:putative ABC transport system permease protein